MQNRRLEEVFLFIRNGVSIKQDTDKGGLPISRIETIANRTIDMNRVGFADIYDENIYSDYLLQIGDILMSHINSTAHLGKTAVFDLDCNLIHGMNLLCLRPDPQIAFYKYVFYYFNSEYFKRQIPRITRNSVNQSSFTVSSLKELVIPLPPLETQKKIAAVLDKAQELIDKRQEQLAKLDEFVQSVFLEMFGDPVLNKKGWEVDKLGEKCRIITGNTPPRQEKGNYGDYIEWIKSDNINTENMIVTQAEEYLSQKGYKLCKYVDEPCVLMTCIAGSVKCIGKVAVANRKVAFNQQINAIVPNGNNVMYIYILLLLSQRYIQSTINMSLKGILSKSKLSELSLIFPPIDLQNQFAAIVEKTEQQKALMQQSLAEMENNFSSLMQRAFKDELF